VLNALFQAGAGRIGHYDECSFSLEGPGTFRGNELSSPHVGEQGSRHHEKENRIEVILRKHQRRAVMKALISHHPYEEVAYELYSIENSDPEMGSGWIGDLAKPQTVSEFLNHLKSSMDLQLIKFTFLKQTIKTVAVCGGSGSFLLADAKAEGADAFVSSDFKYHQFFDAEDQILICDIGHYESEKFTIDLLCDLLSKKMTTFAVLKTEGDTNPVKYFH
jgi:hypothetical protein